MSAPAVEDSDQEDTRLDLRPLQAQQTEGDDLRSMVRQELRKIVQAQHRGIMAMLGALGEDEEEDGPVGASTPHDRSGRKDRGRHQTKRKMPRQHQADHHHDLNFTQDTSFNDRSSLTEVDVTPLPSDEVSLKSMNDRPLTVSDLFKSKTWSPGARYEPSEVGNNVRGALKELKTLENSQTSPNHVHFNFDNQMNGTSPGRMVATPSGKENVNAGFQGQPVKGQSQYQNQGPYGQGQGPMTTQNQAPYQQHPLGFGQEPPHPDQPFSRVFQMLKVMNQNLAQSNTGSGTQSRNVTMTDLGGPGPRLLHVPGPGPQPVRFPPVPSSTTPAARHALPPGGGVGRMPLLHVYAPHRTDEVPVREVTAHHLPPTTHHQHPAPAAGPAQVPFRMPLLKLAPTPQRRVFNHIEDEHGDLRLVPAEDVLAYEARRQEERRQKLEQRRQQMEALGLSGPPVEAMLKKAERRDQRQSDRRKQRRQRVDEDDPMRTSRENLSTAIRLSRAAHQADQGTAEQGLETMSQHVQVDGPEMMTQEVQVTYTPTPREQNTCGVQYPTPRTGSVDREDDGEETEEDQESEELDMLHHGYALTPGLFDEYLMKDGEMGSAQDSAARLHYRAAVGLRPKKLKEVGTGTDGPGWTDTGTITCRDQGTDPVAEALESYMRAKRNLQAGGFVAPDVFMGLKFSENGHTAATGSNEQGGAAKRAFINVVDLDGSALADMVTSLPQRDQQRPATAPSQRKERAKRPPSGRATDPPRSRVEPAEEGEDEEDDKLTGPDRVTAKVLGQQSARDGQPDAGPYSSRIRGHTKDSIRSKLEDMDMQFDAIEAMSRNMENDYKNAKLMIHTIEQMGEAIHPTPSIPHEESPEPTHRGLETSDREDDELTTHLKPSHIGKFHREDKQKQASPRRMQHEPLAETGEEEEGGLSVRDRVSDIRSRLGLSEDMGDDPDEESRPEPGYRDNADEGVPDASGLDITGLSGVSDIIGEVIASGRVDTASLGLTDRQARKLISKAPSGRDVHTINDLQKSGENKRILEERARKRTEKEKEELRSWMEDKRRQRFNDFKNQQQELREREKYPYRPTDDSGQMSTMTFKELEEWEKKRISTKKELEQYNAEMRRKAASELMGDMLTERPDLPPEPLPERQSARRQTAPTGRPGQRTTSTSPARRDKSYSPARRGASRSPARVRPGMQKPTQKSAWNTDPDQTNLHMDDYRHVRDSKDYDRQFRHSGPQQRDQGFVQSGTVQRESAFAHSSHMSGHLSGALNTQTGTSSAGLRAYTRHLEDVQDSFEPDSEIKDATQPEPGDQAEAGQPVYKPKPYTEKVRVQRPEVTRQNRPRPAAKPYVERLSETSQTMNTPRSNTAADRLSQERLYGTKRIPGSQASRVGPRTVKTYQERLKEMKQARTAQPGPIRRYAGPIPGNATVTRSTARPMRRVIKPKKKPMTYSEQLKALQPPKELYRTGTVETPSMTRSQTRGRGRRGPAHKPMTYQEQLQQLQPPKELYRTSLGGTAEYQDSMRSPRVHRTPPQHPLRRSGPYPDPYRPPPEEDVDRASMVSPWDMEDNVRRLLYDDGASSHVGASRTGTDIDMSELQELAGLEDDPYYTDLVDVQEIADVASVSEGSIMSFIDWDQVNDLIADVY